MVGYTRVEAVEPVQLVDELVAFVEDQEAQADEILVLPEQVSFVHCEVRSGLLFFAGNTTILTERVRECLLFYHYDNQCLEILGHLLFEEHLAFQESYISAEEINRPDKRLVYSGLKSENVASIKRCKPYYQIPEQLPALDYGQLADAIGSEMQAVMDVGSRSTEFFAALSEQEQEAYMRQSILASDETHFVGFAYGLLVSGMDRDYAARLVKREKLLLSVRLNRFWTNERLRTVFCHQWFQGLVSVKPVRDFESQFLHFPIELPQQTTSLSERNFLESCAPDGPLPGVYFQLDSSYRANLAADGALSHFELAKHLPACLEKLIQLRVQDLQRKYMLALTEKFFAPIRVAMHREDYQSFWPHEILVDLIHTQCKGKKPDIERAMKLRVPMSIRGVRYLYPALDTRLCRSVILPALLSFHGVFVNLPEIFDDPGQDYLTEKPPERTTYDAAAPVSHEIPLEREQLLSSYAPRYWPPCLQKFLKDSTGDVHLTHKPRFMVTSMLKAFGYNEAQAMQLWRSFFSDTDVYEAENFEKSSHGRVLISDYRSKKERRCAGCAYLKENGMCPLPGDIEEAGRLCSRLSDQQTGRVSEYPIRHPAQYFKRTTWT